MDRVRISAKSGHTLSLLRPSRPQGFGAKENGLVFDVRTDTNDNGGGKVREYRCPARHRIVPYTSIRKSLSSASQRAGQSAINFACVPSPASD